MSVCDAATAFPHRSTDVHARCRANWNGQCPGSCAAVSVSDGRGSHASTALTLLVLYTGTSSQLMLAFAGTLRSTGAVVSCSERAHGKLPAPQ